jgi:SAM-dependent methyltransferase
MQSSARGGIENQIPGDYQLRSLTEGRVLQRAWHRARMQMVARILPPASPWVLDAACGSGLLTYSFGSSGCQDLRIVNLDRRASACRVAADLQAGFAKAVVGLLSALPFRRDTFSSAYLLEAIEHVPPDDSTRVLAELYRVCRSSARCLVTTPNYRSLWPVLERGLDVLRLTPPMRDEQHVGRYDESSLRQLLLSAGWVVDASGSFNLVAPLIGIFSARASRTALKLELGWLRRAGLLLYAVGRHP